MLVPSMYSVPQGPHCYRMHRRFLLLKIQLHSCLNPSSCQNATSENFSRARPTGHNVLCIWFAQKSQLAKNPVKLALSASGISWPSRSCNSTTIWFSTLGPLWSFSVESLSLSSRKFRSSDRLIVDCRTADLESRIVGSVNLES